MTTERNNTNFTACAEWEALLADALDGLLNAQEQVAFDTHKSHCAACAELYDEAQKGRQWLEFLSVEPEAPAGLLEKLLSETGPGVTAGNRLATAGNVIAVPAPVILPEMRRNGFLATLNRFEPRLLMTAAMAFFSIALTLNMTGVHLSELRLSDLRPSMIRSIVERRLTTASTPVIRYYDHLRLVNEVQDRMRELRRATEGEGQQDDGSRQPEQKTQQPGETKERHTAPALPQGNQRVEPQQSAKPAQPQPANNDEILESSLAFEVQPAVPSRSLNVSEQRSPAWTA